MTPPFTVLRVRVPDGSAGRRTPIVIVEGQLGPVRVALTVASRQKNRLELRVPVVADNGPGLLLPRRDGERIAAAAIAAAEADPVAHAVLHRRG
jgi:hypothetical protein